MLYIHNTPYYLIHRAYIKFAFTVEVQLAGRIRPAFKLLRIFKQKYLFSNGQAYHYTTLLFTWLKRFLIVNTDFFTNKLWVLLDQPKIFRHLIQFFHRYIGYVPEGTITSEDIKKRH
jgi:hypothetical protein